MKRVLTFILVLSMVLGSIGMISAAPALEDVLGTKYEDAVERLASLSILEGYPDGTFRPDADITRAEFAAAVVRAKGLESAAEAGKGSATGFTDVPGSHWASGYVGTAAKLGIVNGIGNNLFAPEALVKYEEAVTMVMRALGYDPAAQEKGGYPFGYLITASETGLLDKVKGTQGVAAPRGLVAQLLDNSLEIPLMVRVTYGDRVEHVISGTRSGVLERTLLDEMDFVSTKGEIIDIARVSSLKKNQIKIRIKDEDSRDDGKTKVYKVAGNVDYEAIFGTDVKIWLNDDDEVIFVKIESDEVYFDAIEWDDAREELKLVDADVKYDLAEDVKVLINGSKKKVRDLGDEYDYAKVVLNDEGDVAFIDAYNWDGFIIVEKVSGNYVYGYGDEINAKDYSIVENGRTIDLDALEEGDILFYSTADDGFAEVFNNYVEGEIERIYDNSIKVEGKEYKRHGAKYINEDDKIKYIDSSSLLKDIAEAMQDAGEVAVFLNRAGDMVFLTGDIGDLKTSSDFVFLTADSTGFLDRGTEKWTFDVLNAEGAEVKYDVKDADVIGAKREILKDSSGNLINWAASHSVGAISTEIKKNLVTELKLDTKGKIDEIRLVYAYPRVINVEIETTEKYYEGVKISPDAVVYLIEDFVSSDKIKDIEVELYKDLDFDYINTATFYEKDDKIVAIVVEKSSRKDDNVTHLTVATDDDYKVAGKKQYTLKLVLNGEKVTRDTKVDISSYPRVNKGDLLEVKVDKKTDIINAVAKVPGQEVSGAVSELNTADDKLKIGNLTNVFKLGVDGVVVDATDSYKVITLSTLKNGDSVKALRITNNSNYLDVIVRTAKRGDVPPEGPIVTDGTVTYIDTTYVIVDGEEIEITASAKEFFDNGLIAVGTDIAFELTSADKMYKITAIDGNLTINNLPTQISAFADLTVDGNLVISGNSAITASNVTVTGNLEVKDTADLAATNFVVEGTTDITSTGTVSFNSELHGDVTVDASAGTVNFTNVKFGGDVVVKAGTVTIEDSQIAGDLDAQAAVTVKGDKTTIAGAIKATDPDDVTLTDVSEELEDKLAEVVSNKEFADKVDSISDRNFNTVITAKYKGVNATWDVPEGIDFNKIEEIKVNLYRADGKLLATNVALLDMFVEEFADEDGKSLEFTLGTPFIVENIDYVEKYWTLGEWDASEFDKPATVKLVIVGLDGTEYEIEGREPLVEPSNRTWADIFAADEQ